MFVSGNLSFYGLSFSPASSLSTSFAPSPVSLSRSSSISPSATYIIYFEPSKNSPLSLFLNTQAKKVMKEIGADKSHYYFPHCSLTSFFKCNSNMIQNVVNTLMSIIQKNSDNLRCFYLYGRSCRDISCEDRPNYSEGEREEENEEGAMRKEVKNKKAVVNKNASFTKLFISRTNECESDTLNSSNNNHNSNAGKWVFLSNKEIEDAKNKVLFTKMMAANNCLICYEAIDNNAKNDFCDYNCNCYNKNNFSDFNYNDDNTNDSCMYNINHAVYSNINTNTIITPRSSITSFYSGNTDVQTADSDYETYANSDASCFSSLSSTPVPHAGICTTQTCNFSLSSPTSLPSPLSFVAQYKMNDNFFVNNEFVNLGEQKKKTNRKEC